MLKTGNGILEPMSGYQSGEQARKISTPGAFGLGNAPFLSAFKSFVAMGDQTLDIHKISLEGAGGFATNQLFTPPAYGDFFNKDQF